MAKLYVHSVLDIPDKKHSDWTPKTLEESLIDSYNKQLFVDAEVRVQHRIFKAHKIILAFYSPLFLKAFYGTKIPSSICVINDINPEGFDILLRFLYSSKIPLEADSNNVVDACFAAQILEMTGVKRKLIDYILHNYEPGISHKPIAEKKFWFLLQKSHSLKIQDLKERLLKFAEKHITSILYHKDFATASSEVIKLVLSLKTISDKIKLQKIAVWRDSNRNLDILELCVQDLLTCINFEGLTPQEFYIIASKQDNLISGKDALDILMHLVDPTITPLPYWCSVSDKSMNIPPDPKLSEITVNLENWSKSDKFKSLQNLDKIGNPKSISDRKLFGSQSQDDLRKLDYRKPQEDWSERKTSIEAKVYSKNLPESFSQMLEEGVLTDVALCDKDGTEIPAHRLILALRSEIFANLLYGNTPIKILRLDESAEDLKSMLKHFYGTGEKFSIKTAQDRLDSVLTQYELALKYECYPLMKTCWDVLHSIRIIPSVFWKFLNQGDQLKLLKVNTQLLMSYAQTSPKKVFDHMDFYSASKNSLIRILESDYLNISECDILEYLARWLEVNSSDFPTHNSRKNLFKYIRFEAINAEQFYSFLKQHDELLHKDDAFGILTFLFQESKGKDLPKWCYKGPLRSLFYDTSNKIGTDVLIPWKTRAEEGNTWFRCMYTVTSSNKSEESQVQYLELSWKFKPNKQGKYINHKCSITIKHEDFDPITFNNVDVTQNHRIIVPVFFTLSNQKRKTKFYIEVKAQNFHKCYFINGQKKMTFQNAIIESQSARNCLSDAIVDNCTSEYIQIPKYLLPPKGDVVLRTENCFKVISEDTD